MNERIDRIYNIIKEICDIYSSRGKTQEELADFINNKYKSNFTTKDIAEITQQLGYWHTIKRTDLATVVLNLSETWREHAGS